MHLEAAAERLLHVEVGHLELVGQVERRAAVLLDALAQQPAVRVAALHGLVRPRDDLGHERVHAHELVDDLPELVLGVLVDFVEAVLGVAHGHAAATR